MRQKDRRDPRQDQARAPSYPSLDANYDDISNHNATYNNVRFDLEHLIHMSRQLGRIGGGIVQLKDVLMLTDHTRPRMDAIATKDRGARQGRPTMGAHNSTRKGTSADTMYDSSNKTGTWSTRKLKNKPMYNSTKEANISTIQYYDKNTIATWLINKIELNSKGATPSKKQPKGRGGT